MDEIDRFLVRNWGNLPEASRLLLSHTAECPTCRRSKGPRDLCQDGRALYDETKRPTAERR